MLFVSGLLGLITSFYRESGIGSEAVVYAIFFVGALLLWYLPQEIANEIKRSREIDNSGPSRAQDRLLESL